MSPQLAEKNTSGFETFGQFLFLKKLAAGGMAEVFLARPAYRDGNGRVQVVKRILPHVATNPMFRSMFQTEIQVIMGFNHPQIVQLHDFGELNGQPYISMEYIEGKSLKEIIHKFSSKNEKIPVAMALSLVAQGAAGLHYAHTFVNKITGEVVKAIHRDISPHNLILSYEGNLKVIDFGIAKAASGVQEPTHAGTIKGKIAYLSPEQVTGQPVDARSDVFALGIVAWELLTLRRPFHNEGDSDATILARINDCDDQLLPPSFYNPDVPYEVEKVILKALRKDPEERFATAGEFQAALRKVMMKLYPTYTYADSGKKIRSMFAEEIENERGELRDLNLHAQKSIASSRAAESTVILDSVHSGLATSVVNNLRYAVPQNTLNMTDPGNTLSQVDSRLMKIEKMMKQKSSSRYYFFIAFYVISLLFIKAEDKYSFLKILGFKNPVASQSVQAPKAVPVQRRQVASTPHHSVSAYSSKNQKKKTYKYKKKR